MGLPASNEALIKKWKKIIPVTCKEGNLVDFLIDGPATYAAMHEAIVNTMQGEKVSENYIYILAWWLDDQVPLKTGDADSTLAKLLQKAAQAGVQIRALVWDNFFQDLAPKIVGSFNKDSIDRISKLPKAAAFLDKNLLPHASHHQKVIVTKGRAGLVGFCGGVDISFDRIATVKRHPGSPYHDVHCRIQGDGVRDLIALFVQRWENHPGYAAVDKEKGGLLGKGDISFTKANLVGSQWVGITKTFNAVVNGKPCARDRTVKTTIFNAIDAALRFIYIEDQYLVSLSIAKKLQARLKYIQHLTIVIPHSDISDLPNIRTARANFVSALVTDPAQAAKIRIFYRYSKGATQMDFPHNYVHAKIWVIDDELALIGSANINERGISYDSEVVAAIFDQPPSVAPKEYSFAQKMRIKLWNEHLGLSGDGGEVANGFTKESLSYWSNAQKSADYSVKPYLLSDFPENRYVNTERPDFDNIVDHTFDSISAPLENVSPQLYQSVVDISGDNITACK